MSERMDEISVLSDLDYDSISNIIIEQMDLNEIVNYIDQNFHECTVYLIPKEYSSDGGYESNLFKVLSKDLKSASIACGFNIVRIGTRQWKSSNSKMIRFVCCRYHKFRGHTRAINNTDYNFHHHDYHNDNKNSRGKEGVHCQLKTWTKRAIKIEHTCPFYFYVAFDSTIFCGT